MVKPVQSVCSGFSPATACATDAAVAPGSKIHAAVSALIETGTKPAAIRSLADLVTPVPFKKILRRRVRDRQWCGQNSFNQSLAIALTQIAREWVKVDDAAQAELKKRLLSKVPVPLKGLTDKNKRFLAPVR